MSNSNDNGIVEAVQWGERLLLGSVGTSVMIMAVAILGLFALRGCMDRSFAVRVLLGCFIIIGAPMIAAGIMTTAASGSGQVNAPTQEVEVSPPPLRAPERFDPYGGASVPSS
ncbi:TrbC/VirB2 family protein [Sphingobium scionense]|uniref:Type IV secretory pathway VirB2 component (Pilin) n=1 Tax=Sphingobium scionense TaxID=1404341 RepID=A0A7W6LTK6_9SPHN|nr:TrbC/VirB2 family protein [Sphingobium scionense]MBB4150199.1 type IV secretory pathway VirB2 component (pilin) [Sphingobium scionense]